MFKKLKKLKNKVVPGNASTSSAHLLQDAENLSLAESHSDGHTSDDSKDAPGPQDLVLNKNASDTNISSSDFDPELAKKRGLVGAKYVTDDIKILNEEQKKKARKFLKWWRRFSAVLFSPVFLRHRNLFCVIVEILVPAVVSFIIFAAFTSGISWKQDANIRKEASMRNINYPEVSLESTIRTFRNNYLDNNGRALILYTPVNNFTVLIMQNTLDQLGLRENNRLFKDAERASASGVIGMPSMEELFEWAIYHKGERYGHGKPVGVIFDYEEGESNINPKTNLPFEVSFKIATFEPSIAETQDDYPFVAPARDASWQNPYISTGFIGLQYAIESSFIRMILEAQKEQEVAEIQASLKKSKGRSVDIDVEDEGFDEDLFAFLVADVKVDDELDDDDDDDDDEDAGNHGRSLQSGGGGEHKKHNSSMRSRIIKTVNELPPRSLRMHGSNMYGQEDFRKLVTIAVTFSFVLSYCFMSFFIVKQISEENTSGIKDLLNMHGLPHHMHWIILFFHVMVFRGITSVLILVAIKVDYGNGAVIQLSKDHIMFIVIFAHEICLSFMNFFIAIFIPSGKMAGIFAVACGLLSFYVPETFYEMQLVGKVTDFVLTLIFPNWCLRHIINCIVNHELDNKGITWSNLFETLKAKNTVSVGDGTIRLLVVAIIYFSIACYVDMIQASKLYPPVFKWYQFRAKKRAKLECKELHEKLLQDIEAGRGSEFDKPAVYEEPPPTLKCFVHVRNISKSFGKHKTALDTISINLMHGEITVILGHTGSGKSTLVATLAGLIQPDTGYVVVKGFDVNYSPTRAREYIGFCPQKLVAFNLLTVREHVNLCYRLKGYNSQETNRHVATLLTKLKLWNVRSFLPSDLRLDELRRLGMAMAIADTPKVLMFDEPTAGMDTVERREVWNIILQLKQYHTIIIATNLMQEAEYLADRIALLAHGRLVCFGTIPFLRGQYNTGYFLRIEPANQSNRLDSNAISNFVKTNLKAQNIVIKRNTRIKDVDNLVFELPHKKKELFANMCEELEKKKNDFNISKYSIHRVTLNDIFLRISSAIAAEGRAVDLFVRRDSTGDIKSVLTTEIPSPPTDTERLFTHKYHFQTLVKKRVTIFKSGNYKILLHFICPLVVIWIVVFQTKVLVLPNHDKPERRLTTEPYQKDFQIFYRMGMDDRTVNFTGHMNSVLEPYGVELPKTERVYTKLYEVLNSAPPAEKGYVKDSHMVAFEFRKIGTRNFGTYDFVGYFASGALHSAPTALNMMSNVYLSALTTSEGDHGDRRYKITAINDPMPMNTAGRYEKRCGTPCILMAILMSFSIAFLCHSSLLLPMHERQNGMKHLQFMCGVHPGIYWLGNFAVDVATMFVVTVIIVILYVADYFRTFHNVGVIFTLWFICILYLLWSGLMYSYFMSCIIPTFFNGFNCMAVLHFCLGIGPVLWAYATNPNEGVDLFWRNFFLFLLPPYTITSAFYLFFSKVAKRNLCRTQNTYIQQLCDVAHDPHKHYLNKGHFKSEKEQLRAMKEITPDINRCCPRTCLITNTCYRPPGMFSFTDSTTETSSGLIWDTVALFLQGFIFWGLLIMVEKKVVSTLTHRIVAKFLKDKHKTKVGTENPTISRKMKDVRHESLCVRADITEETFPADVALCCVDLTKSKTTTMIIKDFCLEVKKGSCVAILGRGGSGKSCIAKMIAGALVPTSGNCYTDGASLTENRKDYLSKIGYCPQNSCCFLELTGFQNLELMGSLRGIPPNILPIHVSKWVSVIGLSEVANDVVSMYGDGMVHRLCVAMCFIGDPEIILLDEPTTGVDPLSRERLWAVIEHLHAEDRTVIFTTYSTDEAFSLAEKVVVIAEAGTQCIGSPDELQSTYARGHTILFELRHEVLASLEIMAATEEKITQFKKQVIDTFKHIDLLDEHDEVILFFLRDARFTWAEVYRRATYLATVYEVIIDSYEVNQGEIDDIFIYLTQKQKQLAKPHGEKSESIRISSETAEEPKSVKFKTHQPSM